MYAAAASQWFLEEVGFQPIERVLLPRAALHLPSLAKVPAAAYIFEITPSVNGTRTPRRMVAQRRADLLAKTQPRVCFFGHHHNRLDAEVAGVRCLGLNKGHYPACLVAFEMRAGERDWRLLGEWPPKEPRP